jgi:hypothetical protein
MSNNIQPLKNILTAVIEVGTPVGKALEDGKIQFVEMFPIGYAAIKNISFINEFRAAWREARDLDEAEKAELSAHVAATLDLPADIAERRTEAAFKFLLAGAVFYSEWNLADAQFVGKVTGTVNGPSDPNAASAQKWRTGATA